MTRTSSLGHGQRVCWHKFKKGLENGKDQKNLGDRRCLHDGINSCFLLCMVLFMDSSVALKFRRKSVSELNMFIFSCPWSLSTMATSTYSNFTSCWLLEVI